MAPSNYLNQRWDILNLTLRNKLHWNFTRKPYISFQENAFHNFVCELASILSRSQCLNVLRGLYWTFQWKMNARSLSDGIFITGCTASCYFDSFRCNQWRKFRQNDIPLAVFSFQLQITNLLWFCCRKVWHINRQTDCDDFVLKYCAISPVKDLG